MNKDYKTKCRCLFIITIGLCYDYDIILTPELINSIHSYACDKLINKERSINELGKIIYYERHNNITTAYETQKTIQDLGEMLNYVNSPERMMKLYNEIKQRDIDLITFLAQDYIEYMQAFNEIKHIKE